MNDTKLDEGAEPNNSNPDLSENSRFDKHQQMLSEDQFNAKGFPLWAYPAVCFTTVIIRTIFRGFLFAKLPLTEFLIFALPYFILMNAAKIQRTRQIAFVYWIAPALLFYSLSWISYLISEHFTTSLYFVSPVQIILVIFLGKKIGAIRIPSYRKLVTIMVPFALVDFTLKEVISNLMEKVSLALLMGQSTNASMTAVSIATGINDAAVVMCVMSLVQINIIAKPIEETSPNRQAA